MLFSLANKNCCISILFRTFKSAVCYRQMEKYGIRMLKRTKPILSDLGTYLTKVTKALTSKRLRSQGIDSEELILPAYVAWWAGTTNMWGCRTGPLGIDS
jgi:hypothetical protein